MSSAGLVYKYFGKEIMQKIASDWKVDDISDSEWAKIYHDVYKSIILEVDAIDNGVNMFEKDSKSPIYTINSGLSSRISRLNPNWCEEEPDQSTQFKKAMDYAEDEFLAVLYSKLMVTRPAQKLVQDAFETRKDFHESGEFVWFPKSCPWKGHLFAIEEQENCEGLIKFAFF